MRASPLNDSRSLRHFLLGGHSCFERGLLRIACHANLALRLLHFGVTVEDFAEIDRHKRNVQPGGCRRRVRFFCRPARSYQSKQGCEREKWRRHQTQEGKDAGRVHTGKDVMIQAARMGSQSRGGWDVWQRRFQSKLFYHRSRQVRLCAGKADSFNAAARGGGSCHVWNGASYSLSSMKSSVALLSFFTFSGRAPREEISIHMKWRIWFLIAASFSPHSRESGGPSADRGALPLPARAVDRGYPRRLSGSGDRPPAWAKFDQGLRLWRPAHGSVELQNLHRESPTHGAAARPGAGLSSADRCLRRLGTVSLDAKRFLERLWHKHAFSLSRGG